MLDTKNKKKKKKTTNSATKDNQVSIYGAGPALRGIGLDFRPSRAR